VSWLPVSVVHVE